MNKKREKKSRDQSRRIKRKRIQKQIIKLGSWNVRTLLAPGKLHEVANEMKRYKIDITCLQEIRWSGQGKIEKKEYEMWYSGEDRKGYRGIAFLLQGKIKNKVMDFKAVNGRIAYIRIKSKPNNLSIINVYAPTEQADEREKQGDFNAQIGKEECFKDVTGPYSIHEETNNNGERLCNFAATTGVVVMSTKFKHKRIHKITWMQPGRTDGNQIDHVLVQAKNMKAINDVRSYRGANIDSDHNLVITKCKMKVMREDRKNFKHKWNIERLQDDTTRTNYSTELERTLQDEPGTLDVEEEWRTLKERIITTAEGTIGYGERKKNKQWFDRECQDAIENKKHSKVKMVGDKNGTPTR
ncbi:endonuclease/exonuclease/phosphatase superfamily [Holotrichia oblita]|uniref:Endonuclease/exonuclease/phosphatase superfamily n=1 Tax=Holotrichia oblita TaxID=644536 RepID=A0ACB9SY78_HOLOL|nr:endonuclease/exonuclease/phosphatase superfamily [Holotrichia oblita]